jgi:hypothetical protein
MTTTPTATVAAAESSATPKIALTSRASIVAPIVIGAILVLVIPIIAAIFFYRRHTRKRRHRRSIGGLVDRNPYLPWKKKEMQLKNRISALENLLEVRSYKYGDDTSPLKGPTRYTSTSTTSTKVGTAPPSIPQRYESTNTKPLSRSTSVSNRFPFPARTKSNVSTHTISPDPSVLPQLVLLDPPKPAFLHTKYASRPASTSSSLYSSDTNFNSLARNLAVWDADDSQMFAGLVGETPHLRYSQSSMLEKPRPIRRMTAPTYRNTNLQNAVHFDDEDLEGGLITEELEDPFKTPGQSPIWIGEGKNRRIYRGKLKPGMGVQRRLTRGSEMMLSKENLF